MLHELISASGGENVDQIKILLLDSALKVNVNEIDQFGDSCLHLAAQDNYFDVLELLLANGASPNILDNMRNTPLHLAALIGHLNIVQLLCKHGADINAVNDLGAPIHWAFEHGHWEVISYFITQGANLHIVDKYGYTPLHAATKFSHTPLAIFELLLQKKAPLEAVNNEGLTALQMASKRGYSEYVEILLKSPDISPEIVNK